jgi:hypothetical protein
LETWAAFPETDVDKADLETLIGDLMSGQYSDPVRVVAFNTAEQWSADVSQDVAHEIRRRADLAGEDLAPSIVEFVETQAGPPRQLSLRLTWVAWDQEFFDSIVLPSGKKLDHLTRCRGIHH